MKKKSYLVTGGSGFIGASLVRGLVESGHRVRVLDDGSRGSLRRLQGIESRFEFMHGDIRKAAVVQRAARRVDSIIHLAFVNGTEFFYQKPELVLDVGVKGMVNVLDAALKQGVPELVLASSSEVYQTPPRVPTDEKVPLVIPDPHNPRYSYAAGKIISEIMALNWGRKYLDRVLIFRPHNVYGPDMGWEHVLPQFALRMKALVQANKNGGRIDFPIQGTGRQTRAFIDIRDFTAGLMKVLESGRHREIYHIGTEEEISIRDAAQAVAGYFGAKIRIVSRSGEAPGGTARRCPDISKLRRLGFRPRVPFAEGAHRLCEWYDQNARLAPKRKG